MNKPLDVSPSRFFKLPDELRRGTKAYDLFAALPLAVFYGSGAVFRLRMLHAQLTQIDFVHPKFLSAIGIIFNISALVLGAMFLILLFVRRPAVAGAKGVLPRLVAILGTFLSLGILLLPSGKVIPSVLVISTFLEVGGLAFSIYSLAWLGRSFSIMPEARKLVTGGPYAIARHPLYLGEEIALIGVTLQFFSPWAAAILLLQMACQIYRMNYEEGILAESFPDYSSYKSRVSRLIPGVY